LVLFIGYLGAISESINDERLEFGPELLLGRIGYQVIAPLIDRFRFGLATVGVCNCLLVFFYSIISYKRLSTNIVPSIKLVF